MSSINNVYRLQLSQNFTFIDAIKVLPYLKKLGITTVYCSPIFQASSSHGYDVDDPTKANDHLGGNKEYMRFCRALKKQGFAQILDIVPNHMGVKNNTWWHDVLKNGPNSRYASFFDIDWENGKVILPFLEDAKEYNLPQNDDHYQLIPAIDAATKINYRRFFNINDLIAFRIEHKEAFDASHKWIFSLIKQGYVQGLRIDHPDGLYEPLAYLKKLPKKYIIVEKILARDEELRDNWPVEGSVGYDFLNMLNGVFVDTKNEKHFNRIYKSKPYDQLLYEKKKLFAKTRMPADVHSLVRRLKPLCTYTEKELFTALVELIARFPVYRSYITQTNRTPSALDRKDITKALRSAKIKPALKTYLRDILLLKKGKEYRDFILRFQQLTAPITAKGLEDTTLYVYNRLISLNEVGGNPSFFGTTIEEFHRHNEMKRKKWPKSFLATSTHDTKRSEDVRSRINVLSEIPEEWEKKYKEWSKLNAKYKPKMEYFIYQTLIGAYPISQKRMCAYLIKAAREAKEETSWMYINSTYENELITAYKKMMSNPIFLKSFKAFHKKIALCGQYNSLAQITLKLGSPGVVDIYQGTESFQYTLVDPDNRRKVDFTKLDRSKKFHLYSIGLHHRKKEPKLYLEGEYIPLKTKGSDQIIAFARSHKNKITLFLAGRFFTRKRKKTEILLPKKWQNITFTDLLTDRKLKPPLTEKIFDAFPSAILTGVKK